MRLKEKAKCLEHTPTPLSPNNENVLNGIEYSK